MQKKEKPLKRTRRLTIVDWDFVERRVIMLMFFSESVLNALKMRYILDELKRTNFYPV